MVVVTFVALGATARWWLRFLLDFVDVHTDRIQGLTDLVQLVIWVFGGLSGLGAWWLGKRKTGPERERIDAAARHVAVGGSGSAARTAPWPLVQTA